MRLDLVRFGEFEFTVDTVAALRKLEERVATLKGRLSIQGRPLKLNSWDSVRTDPGPTGLPPEQSAALTGREVCLRIQLSNTEDSLQRGRELAMLWAIALPLGFVPFSRYPLPGSYDQVFHVFGGWSVLMDNLLGAGRGEEGWPGFCCAAQLDVDRWEGGRMTERLVQAHLHRIGFPVGAIDGIVGTKTQGGLKAANLHSTTLAEVANRVVKMPSFVPVQLEKPFRGQLEMAGVDFSIHPYGQVRTTKTLKGAEFLISGPGRVVIDVRGPT